jgi:hypothetical protein
MLLGELCRRIRVEQRHVRDVLKEGFLPNGVGPQPGPGNHRQLSPAQAFWFAIVLKLKASALRTPLAAEVADYARDALRSFARQLGWDSEFAPFNGRLGTEKWWYVEVGDLQFVRLVSDANPDGGGLVFESPWTELEQEPRARRLSSPRRR